MEITFDSSSTAAVTYPKPPPEYVFKPGVSRTTAGKKKHGGIGIIIVLFIIAAAAGVSVHYKENLFTSLKSADVSGNTQDIPALPTARVINANLNVRSGPSTKNSVVIQVHKDDILTVTGMEENGWLPVDYNGKAGFVSAELVKVNE
jgi:uncharacterized protein YgiM (DUF1202 family)